jgi:hypothetical protein
MNISERLDLKYQTYTVDSLETFVLTSAENLQDFYNACQTTFVSTLISANAKLRVRGEVYEVTPGANLEFFDTNAERLTANNICAKKGAPAKLRQDMADSKADVIFNFFVGAEHTVTRKAKNAYAEYILDKRIEVLAEDESFDDVTYNKLLKIHSICNIAAKDPANYANNLNAVKLRDEIDAANAEGNYDEAEALKAKLDDIADDVTIETKASLAQKANEAHRDIIRKVQKGEIDVSALGITDVESFLLGWLAKNVSFICAYVPYTVKRGRINRSAKMAFQRDYPESRFIGEVSLADVARGAAVIHPAPRPGYYSVPRYDTTKGKKSLRHRNKLFCIRFRPDALRTLPNVVNQWLSTQYSAETGEYVRVQPTMESSCLATFLYSRGFPIDAVTQDVVNAIRGRARNTADFDKGYNWPPAPAGPAGTAAPVTAAPSITVENELDLDFPEVETVTASDYDQDYID